MKPTRNDVMIETRQLRNGVHVGRTLLPPDDNHFKVCVVNTTNRPQLLTAGTLLGQPVAVSTIEDNRPRVIIHFIDHPEN